MSPSLFRSAFVFLVLLLSTALPILAISPSSPIDLTPAKRAAVLTTNVCSNIAITVPLNVTVQATNTVILLDNIQLNNSVCVCLYNGALTPTSLDNLNAAISDNPSALAELTQGVGVVAAVGTVLDPYTSASLQAYVNYLATEKLQKTSTACNYPAGTVPDSCSGDCGYSCPDNGYLCGTTCVTSSASCQSGVPKRRRDANSARRFTCPKGFTSCPVSPPSLGTSSTPSECINTLRDLESCGGCIYPVLGETAGQDCTSIPHAGSVSCMQGACVVDSCERGWQLASDKRNCERSQAERPRPTAKSYKKGSARRS